MTPKGEDMSIVAKTESGEKLEHTQQLKPRYLESLNLVERLHRQLLDVIKDELDRRGERVVNSVQALFLVTDVEQQERLHAVEHR